MISPLRRLTGRLRWWHVYLIVLLLSQLWQGFGPTRPRPQIREHTVEVARHDAHGPTGGRPVRIAYDEFGSGPPIIYLHGSPGSAGDARRLAAHLESRFRLVALDLPGFGESTRWLPDYGIEAHARYVLALMDRLEIERAHFVAHSMGSGVALHINRLAPRRVATISSYAGIGIQEGEGSGDYHLEHLKYAVGYGLLVVAPEVVPHFGLLGSRAGRHAFIRNFWDTDQRPLRELLEKLEAPLLILHGRDDPLVRAWVAEEHHRIVGHSELVMLDASHFLVFTRRGSARLAAEILPFLERHEQPGTVPTRRTIDYSAGPTEVGPLPTDLRVHRGLSPWAQIALLFSATFVSEDLTSISAGLLARAGRIDLFVAILGCFAGIFVSDIWLWAMGRAIGRRVLRWRWISRRIPAASVDRFGQTFDRHLVKAVVASRFLPGTRLPMYVAAGVVSKRPVAFVAWLFVAAGIWTPLLVVLAMSFGPAVAKPFEAVLGVGWWSWIGAVVLLFVLVRTAGLALSWRGRARLMASVSRLWRWEFWPVWLFYLPVFVWIGILAIRHRGITTPTAANPAVPHGGFVGESKSEIQHKLPAEWIVPGCLIPPAEPETRLESFRRQVESNGWTFPLILKPDEGQRGAGLKLAKTWNDVAAYLRSQPRAVLVQTFHAGPHEAGIFYYRLPGEPQGRIFSITHKRFPEVVGDGRSTLEELILRHKRLRMQAGTFLRRWADRLSWVPDSEETVRLAVAGNHCQGTMFCDGAHLLTQELETTVDTIAQRYAGFYFGRFDVRYGDVERFKAGADFKIIELNGVTSESTNVYDPTWSLLSAYKTLCKQWSLAYRIGSANRDRGHPTSSLWALMRAARSHYHHRQAETLAD